MMSERMGPIKLPDIPKNPSYDAAKKDALAGSGPGSIDFDSLMGDSNSVKKDEMEKEAAAAGPDGALNVGDTKSDKEFRNMLEKVTGKKQERLKNKLEKDDYLNLMVTQMKNQDPLKPMENSEMATQLAQFNSVEQLMAVNKTLTDMKASQAADKSEKLTQYLGKNIEVEGGKLRINQDFTHTKASFSLASASGSTALMVKNAAGEVIRRQALGVLETGAHAVEWDGKDDKGIKMPTGGYTFSIEASTSDGKPIPTTVSHIAKVEGIKDISMGGKLETALGSVEAKDILSIRASDFVPQKELIAASTKEVPDTAPMEQAALAKVMEQAGLSPNKKSAETPKPPEVIPKKV